MCSFICVDLKSCNLMFFEIAKGSPHFLKIFFQSFCVSLLEWIQRDPPHDQERAQEKTDNRRWGWGGLEFLMKRRLLVFF